MDEEPASARIGRAQAMINPPSAIGTILCSPPPPPHSRERLCRQHMLLTVHPSPCPTSYPRPRLSRQAYEETRVDYCVKLVETLRFVEDAITGNR